MMQPATPHTPAAKPGAVDVLVLTVANDAQRIFADLQLERRRERGLLPAACVTLVLADPKGARIGSGGSTLLALSELAKRGLLTGHRTLILHSGGDGRRLPAWSSTGKIWVPLFRHNRGGDSQPALFDLIFAELSRLRFPSAGGVLVASGDAALRLKNEQITFESSRPSVLAFPAGFARARKHGVFVLGTESCVLRTLQKPTQSEVMVAKAVRRDGKIMVDSGVFFFPTHACHALLAAAGADPRSGRARARSLMACLAVGKTHLDLYQECASLLARSESEREFLTRFAKNRSTSDRAMLRQLYRGAHRLGLTALPLSAGRFLHLGTTEEFANRLSSTEPERMFAEWIAPRLAAQQSAPIMVRRIEGLPVKTAQALRTGTDVAVAAIAIGNKLWCITPHGVSDDCKSTADQGGTVCGRPLNTLAARAQVSAETIWKRDPQSLWFARIFPVGAAEQSWNAVKWLVSGGPAPASWHTLPKMSFAQVLQEVNPRRMFLAESRQIDHAHASKHAALATKFARAEPLQAARHWAKAATALTAESSSYRVKALNTLGAAVASYAPWPKACNRWAVRVDQAVWASAPVRIDLAGGWSDTPPLCVDHGGSVVNAALTLAGTHPLQTMARVIDEPHISLHSVDSGRTALFTQSSQLLDHQDPREWSALPKAALVLSGLVPRTKQVSLQQHLADAGGGLAITLFSAVPKGSGLGTSSILGATLLATLDRVAGRKLQPSRIVEATSILEQMISTRGGWQDQVGGMWGGIKFSSTRAGILQSPRVEPIAIHPTMARTLKERAILYFSGERRMARNILQTVVLRYLAGDQAVLKAREQLVTGAVEMAHAIATGNLDAFCERLSEYRTLKQIVDPASVSPGIERIASDCGSEVRSWSVAGAGGGGFILLICRSKASADRLRRKLQDRPAHPLGRPFDFDIDPDGLRLAAM